MDLFRDILSGLGTQIQQRVVLVNAAFAIQCFKQNASFESCYQEAEEALLSGNALAKLKRVIALSKASNLISNQS